TGVQTCALPICIGRSRAIADADEIVGKPESNHEYQHGPNSQHDHGNQETTPPLAWPGLPLRASNSLHGRRRVQARHAWRALGDSTLFPAAIERVVIRVAGGSIPGISSLALSSLHI